jgi:hypothetical protein
MLERTAADKIDYVINRFACLAICRSANLLSAPRPRTRIPASIATNALAVDRGGNDATLLPLFNRALEKAADFSEGIRNNFLNLLVVMRIIERCIDQRTPEAD